MTTEYVSPGIRELLSFTEAHHRHTIAMARATGEHFNIFQILGVGHLEVKTHSPILADLLDPRGSHGQGTRFLQLFHTQFISDWRGHSIGEEPSAPARKFDPESEWVAVDKEYFAGPVDEKSGGRIDILIKDGKGGTIVIENKIYAVDQDNQIERNRAFDPGAHLFYLTLNGRMPNNEAEVKGLRCISYKEDVLRWLEACRKECACVPVVRETITQYIHLLKELTQQSNSTQMNEELSREIVKTPESLQAFFILHQAYGKVLEHLIAAFSHKLDEIATAAGLELNYSRPAWGQKEQGFGMTTPALARHNIEICFSFDRAGFCDCYFGFALIDSHQDTTIADQLKEAFCRIYPLGNPLTRTTPAFAWWPRRDWGSPEFEALRSGAFEAEMRRIISNLASIATQVCKEEPVSDSH
jgi:hypothetical protein